MPSGKQVRRAPIVLLDAIDVLQMAYASIEVFPREAYGLFLGTRLERGGQVVYRIDFVQVLQAAHRIREGKIEAVAYSDRSFAQLRQRYPRPIIGDFHSHVGADAADSLSHADLQSALLDDPRGLYAVLHIVEASTPVSGERIVRKEREILCAVGDFEIRLRFYAFRHGVTAIRRNVSAREYVRVVLPRLRPRKRIDRRPLTIV